MKTRNVLTALFGFWFVISPWVLGLTIHPVIVWTSLCLGMLQLCASLLALKKSKLNILENWLTLLTGLWFAIFSINFTLSFSQTWSVGLLGILTVALVLWNMDTTL
ncbi:SPW repeat domain-containing protein [Paenibacillus periandrae]|uniref:SPW repeat domain-containing protein n=1 Tax=Paenibacillus periandrae TaxID=1761741 RepID=UPI001F093D17|nr:SPW repeat protein [Paenibacillus periandrae]